MQAQFEVYSGIVSKPLDYFLQKGVRAVMAWLRAGSGVSHRMQPSL
jgi:hypothetical protein